MSHGVGSGYLFSEHCVASVSKRLLCFPLSLRSLVEVQGVFEPRIKNVPLRHDMHPFLQSTVSYTCRYAYSLLEIFFVVMQFWRLARNGISPPYFPSLPSSTSMKWEWLLSRHAPSDNKLELMWYVTTPCIEKHMSIGIIVTSYLHDTVRFVYLSLEWNETNNRDFYPIVGS